MARDDPGGTTPAGPSVQIEHEPGTVPLRPVVIVGAALLLGLLGYLGHSCTQSTGQSGTFIDAAARYPAGSVTYLAAGRTYLVHLPDGGFVALSEAESSQTDWIAGCVIRFRPDLQAGAVTGVFRDDCHGALYGRDGRPLDGDAPPMQRHPTMENGKQLVVHLKVCISGQDRVTVETCRE